MAHFNHIFSSFSFYQTWKNKLEDFFDIYILSFRQVVQGKIYSIHVIKSEKLYLVNSLNSPTILDFSFFQELMKVVLISAWQLTIVSHFPKYSQIYQF